MAARSRFYASMSHELRTPINAVLGYSTLLLENIYGPLNEKQAEGITAHAQGGEAPARARERRARPLEDRGGEDRPASCSRCISRSSSTTCSSRCVRSPTSTARTLALEHEGEPIKIVTDPRRVRQILLNLLSNAIKFGRGQADPGAIADARRMGGFEIEVARQGRGSATADLREDLRRVRAARKDAAQEGTGLGLPISKRLADLLHGELLVHSKPSEGSRFQLILPTGPEPRPSGEENARQAATVA